MDDKLYDSITLYVSDNTYPDNVQTLTPKLRKAAKRTIRNKANGFSTRDGVLYKGDKRVLRANEISSVLASAHSGKYMYRSSSSPV